MGEYRIAKLMRLESYRLNLAFVVPDNNRGLAFSPDGDKLHSPNNSRAIIYKAAFVDDDDNPSIRKSGKRAEHRPSNPNAKTLSHSIKSLNRHDENVASRESKPGS
jgi:hypothetical protein